MYLHEYQAKELLARYGIALPRGRLADRAAAAETAARELGGAGWVVKAQILAGGRGPAGGIGHAETPQAAQAAARELLGKTLVTTQTGPAGKTVRRVYVEERIDGARELYLALLVDRESGRPAALASRAGGDAIERMAAEAPEGLHRRIIDPAAGPSEADAQAVAAALGLEGGAAAAAGELLAALYRALTELDASLIEINPLGLTREGTLCAIDAKIDLDDNALFRHPELAALREADDVEPTELEAARYEINYVKLGGDIGCMVNGAGLALATLDLIKQSGGAPADFMDVRPVATREQIATGFELVLGNPEVKAIVVNMFGGGIMRCDTLAEGIALAVRRRGLGVPLVVRAAGTNEDIAEKALKSQGVAAVFFADMAEAARAAVAAAQRGHA